MAQNYVLLERIELNDTTTSVTFSNIPQTGYTDLKIVMSARNATNTETTGAVYFNADTTNANYTARRILGDGSSASSLTTSRPDFFYMDTTGETANTFANCEMYIPNYTGSTQKSVSAESVTENNATGALAVMVAGLWTGTAAITSIQIRPYTAGGGNFASGSTFSLYGIAAVGTTPVVAPKADGGNVIATDGTYWYHAFLSNGTFTPQTALSADVLVVAGGGGAWGGGGGITAFTSQSLSSTGYSCTVGAGGASGGTSGGNSQFGSLTAAIGGGGTNLSGGSGGGGYPSTGGAGTSGQGYAGGSGATNTGGGGGGAGGVGQNASSNGPSTNGGIGATYNTLIGGTAGPYAFIDSMGAATNTGQLSGGHYYFAGGGTGAGSPSTGTGGLGGGGTQGGVAAGKANTGGGGADSAAGGSGIIIIRYPVAS